MQQFIFVWFVFLHLNVYYNLCCPVFHADIEQDIIPNDSLVKFPVFCVHSNDPAARLYVDIHISFNILFCFFGLHPLEFTYQGYKDMCEDMPVVQQTFST